MSKVNEAELTLLEYFVFLLEKYNTEGTCSFKFDATVVLLNMYVNEEDIKIIYNLDTPLKTLMRDMEELVKQFA